MGFQPPGEMHQIISDHRGRARLYWSLRFLVVSVTAGLLGFGVTEPGLRARWNSAIFVLTRFRGMRVITQGAGRRIRSIRLGRLNWRRGVLYLAICTTVITVALVGAGVHHVYFDRTNLPDIELFARFDFPTIGTVYDANGQPLWTANGQVVCDAPNDQFEPKLVRDGSGGAVIAWIDYRAGNGFTDIYCQRVLADGTSLFPGNGVPICVAPNTQWNVQLTDDGAGNCIVVWQDRRAGSYDNIFAQKIDGAGATLWTTDGVAVAPIAGTQYYPQVASDKIGGAVITWQDNRLGNDYNIYAQHVGANGQQLWSPGGLSVCSSTGHQYNPQIVGQGNNFIIGWQDKRNGDFDIYAQRITSAGATMWKTNGEPVAQIPYDQFLPQMVSDNVNGAILAWADYQNGTGTTDLYAHRIGANGKMAGGCFRSFIQQSLGVKGLRIRQRNSPVVLNKPNEGNVRDSVFGRGAFATGLVLGIERRDSNRTYGWEYFTRSFYVRNALPQNGAPRPFDFIFDRRFVNKLRNPSVYRYDNRLAGELLTLRLNIAASDVGITDPGFGDLVYRDTAETPNILHNRSLRSVAATVDSTLTYWSRYRGVNYIVLANALAGINGAFAGVLETTSTAPMHITSVRALFGVPFLVPGLEAPTIIPPFISQEVDEDVPEGFSLFQNYPNPFNPVTTIEFNLNEPSMVSLKVFNTLGQEVATLVDDMMTDEGRQLVDFDASKLSSGVYFYRLVADPVSAPGRLTSTVKKMILLK